MRNKTLCSKSFASWMGTFDSLSCMACPAVFSQWPLAFFVWEAFLWGWEPGDECSWFWMRLIWSSNPRRCCGFARQAVRGPRVPFWNAALLVWPCPRLHPCAVPQTHLCCSWGPWGAASPLAPCPRASGAPSPCFMSYFSPLHTHPARLGVSHRRPDPALWPC